MLSFLKKLAKSKLAIANTLTVLIGVLGYLAGHEVIVEYPQLVAGLLAASGVLNVIARLFGSAPADNK